MPPPELHYAPRPPLHRRRVLYRWMTVLGCAAIAGVAALWVPIIWELLVLLYWQQRCMAYTPPANQVVYDSTSHVHIVPREWAVYFGRLEARNVPGSMSSGTIFLHQLKSPGGKIRLVALNIFGVSGNAIETQVIKPGDIFHFPQETAGLPTISYRAWFRASESLTVKSSLVDPNDPGHFILQCVEDGEQHTYDGWLGDNDRIEFAMRSHK